MKMKQHTCHLPFLLQRPSSVKTSYHGHPKDLYHLSLCTSTWLDKLPLYDEKRKRRDPFLVTMQPPHSMSRDAERDSEDAFGWHLFHDRQRNLIYYLHSYTGEVRWPRPETVGFVMHGLKPLPADASLDARTDRSFVNPDIWSPYYPHVVMLPSGLVQVHPGPASETQDAAEMWCGYNRFPLSHVKNPNAALPEQHGTTAIDTMSMLASEPRVLPPTWEESRSGSPFLPPYPVVILKRDETEDKCNAAASRSPLDKLDERFHLPAVDVPSSYSHVKTGDVKRVHGSMDWPTTTITSHTTTKVPVPKQPACSRAPSTEKKEHNRKGYLLRQARRMMRESGVASTVATSVATFKQRKDQQETTLRLGRPLDNNQANSTTYGDYDPSLSSQC